MNKFILIDNKSNGNVRCVNSSKNFLCVFTDFLGTRFPGSAPKFRPGKILQKDTMKWFQPKSKSSLEGHEQFDTCMGESKIVWLGETELKFDTSNQLSNQSTLRPEDNAFYI